MVTVFVSGPHRLYHPVCFWWRATKAFTGCRLSVIHCLATHSPVSLLLPGTFTNSIEAAY